MYINNDCYITVRGPPSIAKYDRRQNKRLTPPLGNPMSVADPGFLRGGGANRRGGYQLRFCQIFPTTA